jgi:hypothetical protein
MFDLTKIQKKKLDAIPTVSFEAKGQSQYDVTVEAEIRKTIRKAEALCSQIETLTTLINQSNAHLNVSDKENKFPAQELEKLKNGLPILENKLEQYNKQFKQYIKKINSLADQTIDKEKDSANSQAEHTEKLNASQMPITAR